MEEKAEILHQLKTTRQLNSFRKTSLWRQAFGLYHNATGTRLSLNCAKCFTTVKEWMQKD